MKIKIFQIVIIFLFVIIFSIFFKGLKNSNLYVPDKNLKKPIPLFSVNLFETNEEINSKKIFESDQFYLMNIWSSWCVPCREEHKFLVKLSEQKDLKIIGLNYKDKIENAKNFLNELNNPYDIILSDYNGTVAIEWGAYGVPETFLIYKKKIIKKIIGPLNKDLTLEIIEMIK